jgi:hypothetical protein
LQRGFLVPVLGFIRAGKPPSYNSWNPTKKKWHEQFRTELQQSYTRVGGRIESGWLYGFVAMFVHGFDVNNDPDADNLSKPVWDSLASVAYVNDSDIRLRIASVIDVGPLPNASFTLIDPANFPAVVLTEVARLLREGAGHFVYVEIGPLESTLAFEGLGKWEERSKR